MPQIRQPGTRTRDLLGYAGSPPDPHWPGGARVAVSIVVNFEEGAEFSISDGDPENEAVYEIEQRLAGRPDPAIDSHFEYGSRAGWWRIMEVLGQHGAPATVSSSGRAVERATNARPGLSQAAKLPQTHRHSSAQNHIGGTRPLPG
jgi:peptidoglycan/xylan/chitin deacetylase (PgdA/CDA1 family)